MMNAISRLPLPQFGHSSGRGAGMRPEAGGEAVIAGPEANVVYAGKN